MEGDVWKWKRVSWEDERGAREGLGAREALGARKGVERE